MDIEGILIQVSKMVREDLKKKTVKRMTSCKKEGGGWVKLIISNSLKLLSTSYHQLQLAIANQG